MPLQDFILAQSIRFIAYNYYLGRHYDERSDQKPRPTIPLIMIHLRIWWFSFFEKSLFVLILLLWLYLE